MLLPVQKPKEIESLFEAPGKLNLKGGLPYQPVWSADCWRNATELRGGLLLRIIFYVITGGEEFFTFNINGFNI